MKEENRLFYFILIIFVIAFTGMAWHHIENSGFYKIRITFCDGRKDVITTVHSVGELDNSDIDNYGRSKSVPTFRSYLNVCNIQTIERVK